MAAIPTSATMVRISPAREREKSWAVTQTRNIRRATAKRRATRPLRSRACWRAAIGRVASINQAATNSVTT